MSSSQPPIDAASQPDVPSSEQRRREVDQLMEFPFVDALFGRRSRRFFRVPDGPLAFQSRHEPLPLTELERALILTAAGNTGWHHSITRHDRYAPHLSNDPGTACGRTFPSAAGFHTSELFFTDDTGTYIFETRDAPALTERDADGRLSLVDLVKAHGFRVRKLSDERVYLKPSELYMEGHNSWVANPPICRATTSISNTTTRCSNPARISIPTPSI